MADEKKEKYSSIFDAASKIERKKAVERVLSEGAEAKKEKQPLLTDEEIAQKFERYQKLHNLLADELERAFVKNNLTPNQLHDYFNSPQNFTSDQWYLIESEKENVDEMITKLLPEDIRRSREGASHTEEKSPQKKPKKMQVKSRWMPMR